MRSRKIIGGFAPLAMLTMLAGLSACGQKGDLEPAAGQSLPVAPLGADVQPDARDLLEPETQAAPERSVELRKRSEDREDDPFDLPPE
ncbi:LPS translocon maturation chaperone LptM [Allopontixanthobacter confluentis]|nr:lipoprotein [Allopontixanthobacter confluentis]